MKAPNPEWSVRDNELHAYFTDANGAYHEAKIVQAAGGGFIWSVAESANMAPARVGTEAPKRKPPQMGFSEKLEEAIAACKFKVKAVSKKA